MNTKEYEKHKTLQLQGEQLSAYTRYQMREYERRCDGVSKLAKILAGNDPLNQRYSAIRDALMIASGLS